MSAGCVHRTRCAVEISGACVYRECRLHPTQAAELPTSGHAARADFESTERSGVIKLVHPAACAGQEVDEHFAVHVPHQAPRSRLHRDRQVPPGHPRVRLPRSRRASSSADRCCEMICQSHRIPLILHLASFVRWRAESTLRAEWIAVTRDVSLSRVRAEGFRLPSSSLLDRVDAYLAGIGKAHSPVGLFVGAWSLPTVQPTAQVHKRVALM
jgi:hypothetical protein